MQFKDRKEAGEKLALELENYKNNPDTIILGLPRGGVVIAYHIAQKLNLPMDIIVTRKIGAPDFPEFAIGAVDETGETYLDKESISTYNISKEYIDTITKKEKDEAIRRLNLYRKNRPYLDLKNKTVIITDDGIATGATIKSAIKSAKSKGAKKIVVAVPILAKENISDIKNSVDELVYIDAPLNFFAIGQYYKSFDEVSDDEVIKLMKSSL